MTPDGRYFLAGLFGEDGVALLDLWQPDRGAREILENYGRGREKLPVFKMPHLRGWSVAQGKGLPAAIGRHEVLVVDTASWAEVGRIQCAAKPVFVIARPDGAPGLGQFAFPDNGKLDVIDTLAGRVIQGLQPGQGILHMGLLPAANTSGFRPGRQPGADLRHRHLLASWKLPPTALPEFLYLPPPHRFLMDHLEFQLNDFQRDFFPLPCAFRRAGGTPRGGSVPSCPAWKTKARGKISEGRRLRPQAHRRLDPGCHGGAPTAWKPWRRR